MEDWQLSLVARPYPLLPLLCNSGSGEWVWPCKRLGQQQFAKCLRKAHSWNILCNTDPSMREVSYHYNHNSLQTGCCECQSQPTLSSELCPHLADVAVKKCIQGSIYNMFIQLWCCLTLVRGESTVGHVDAVKWVDPCATTYRVSSMSDSGRGACIWGKCGGSLAH